MKISIGNVFILVTVVGMLIPGTAFGDTARKLTGISAQLELSNDQALEVEKIFKMTQSQAVKDRETFKGNAMGLVQTARQRRRTSDQLIFRLLKPEQRQKFFNYLKKRQRNEELEMLTEGLMLSGEQVTHVKRILNEFREKWEKQMRFNRSGIGDMMTEGDMMPGSGAVPHGGLMPNDGVMPNSGMLPGGGMMPRSRMRAVPGSMQDQLLQDMKSQNAAKAKKINKILTPEQKKMYKTVLKLQDKELEEAFRRMSQNGK